MKTIIITRNCKGDNEHPPHQDPAMLFSFATEATDALTIQAMGMSLSLIGNEENDVLHILRNTEALLKISDGLKSLLMIGDGENEEGSECVSTLGVFDEIEELDVNVEFKA